MKILVVGCNGMLGSKFMSSKSDGIEFVGFDYPEIDITSKESISNIISKDDYSIIINCAAYTDVDGCESNEEKAIAVNGDGPRNLAVVSRENGIVFVHFSTDYVFDGKATLPYKENDNKAPDTVYGKTKLMGERGVVNNCDTYFICRTAWLYGENGSNFVETMLALAKKNKKISVVNDQKGSPTYTGDLVKMVIDLIKSGSYGVYHTTNEGETTWFDFTKEIFNKMNLETEVLPCGSDKFPRPAKRPSYSVLSKHKIKSVGVEVRDWHDALTDYLNNRS